MSSHHIIRENQEPALLILDIDALMTSLLQELLEWSPLIVTTSENVDYLTSMEVRIDAVVSTNEHEINAYQDVRILKVLSDTKKDVLTACFSYLKEKNQHQAYLLWNDFEFTIFEENIEFKLVVFSENQRFIRASNHEKWLPKGQKIKIISPEENRFSHENLTLVEDNCYEVVEDGFVHIKSAERVLIGEEL